MIGVYVDDEIYPAKSFASESEAKKYVSQIPKGLSVKVMTSAGQELYRRYADPTAMEESYDSNQLDTQSMPHGRKTFYERVQNEARPSALRRKGKPWAGS